MSRMTTEQAIHQALAEEMQRDGRVLLMGEGGATKRGDLVRNFGAARVRKPRWPKPSSPVPRWAHPRAVCGR
ncbi:hypothetical protein [Thiobacillus sp.]